MQAIINNPYRITGTLVGTTATDDYSFPVLGSLLREVENLNEASSKLKQDNDKMIAALFWFYKGNSIEDELALEALTAGDFRTSLEIWMDSVASDEINKKNCSAYHNLSTLLLCFAFAGTIVYNGSLFEGTELKLKYFESDYYVELKTLATSQNYKISRTEMELLFLKTVQQEIEMNSNKDDIFQRFTTLLNDIDFVAKEAYFDSLI